MSGAVEGVDPTDTEFLRDLAGRLFRTATPAMGFDQGDTDRLYRIARDLTTPPARSYADGVEDAAKVSENLCADMTVEANAETASLTSTLHRASAQTAGKIAAAIRLLSQGEKA